MKCSTHFIYGTNLIESSPVRAHKKGESSMETARIAKQMIGFQKTVFDNSFNALSAVQDQTESMLTNFMGQLPWVTEEGKKQIDDAFSYTQKARNDFKKVVDEGYSRFESFFDQK